MIQVKQMRWQCTRYENATKQATKNKTKPAGVTNYLLLLGDDITVV